MLSTFDDSLEDHFSAEQAYGRLYLAHRGRLLQYARVKGCDEHDAEDVVQDLFVRLIRLGLLMKLCAEPDTVQTAHLTRTLRSMIMNRWRHRVAMCRGGGTITESLDVMNDAGHDMASEQNPETEIDRAWAMAVLDRSTRLLSADMPPERWKSIEPALFDEEAPPEAKVPKNGAFRVATFRARQRLRELLTRECGFGLDTRGTFHALRDALACA